MKQTLIASKLTNQLLNDQSSKLTTIGIDQPLISNIYFFTEFHPSKKKCEKNLKLAKNIIDQKLINSKLQITLEWYSRTDLDLEVTCPCGTVIMFNKKKCDNCGSWLDKDMR